MSAWTRVMPRRWLAVAMLVAVLIVAGLQAADPHSYVSEVIGRIGGTASGPEADLTDLTSVDQFQADFNRDAGHTRLILLLSPT